MSIYDKSSLVLIPSGTKTSKVYSQVPTNGDGDFDFTRSTAATRVNADGNIEKETSNLLTYSNDLSNGVWNHTDASSTGGQSGYDGSNDAWLLNSSSGGNSLRRDISVSGINTFSIYAKAGTANGIRIRFDQDTDCNAYIDLTDGSVFTEGNTLSINVYPISGGWYRISVAMNNIGLNLFRLIVTDGTTTTTAGTIYVQDAQVEQGLVARDYIETTTAPVYVGITDNTPRLDYTDSSCPALLLEPQRTNLVTNSDYINGLPDVSNVSVTTNATTSPEGVVNASKVVASAANTFHWVGETSSASTGLYTASIFAKSAELEQLYIVIRANNGADRYGVKFQINNKNVIDTITFGSPTQTSSSIEDYGNGWVRFSVSIYNTSGNVISLFGPSLGGALSDINNSFLGDGSSGIYMFGAQVEAGSYATSYIPTYGTSVTRARDLALGNNADIFNSSEGTLFLDFKAFKDDTSFRYIALSDGSISNRVTITLDSQYRIQSAVSVGGVTQSNIIKQMSSVSLSEGVKIAMTYKNNEFKSFVNGVETTPRDISGNTFVAGTLRYLRLNQGNLTSNPFFGNVKQVLTFNTALTDSELATLTTI